MVEDDQSPIQTHDDLARAVLAKCCPGMGWSEDEKRAIVVAMLAFAEALA